MPKVYLADKESNITLDDSSYALNAISYEHHEIHSGSSYHVDLSTANLGGETGDQLQLSFTTPNTTKWLHMVAQSYGSGQHLFTMREAPTGGLTGGTAVTPLNRNRNSIKTSIVTDMKNGASAGTGGTILTSQDLGQGSGNEGTSRGITEWILKQNTVYAFRVYDTTNIQAVLTLDWYEHTDKE